TGESPEEILRLALESEIGAIAQFNAAAEECRGLGDNGTAAIFDASVQEEEEHADWFEAQLQAIDSIGAAAYLAQQVDPASAPK
ncbi:MAG TPA: ferritin-like domain-containing protein, partial [Acidimicrobiia bacterium]